MSPGTSRQQVSSRETALDGTELTGRDPREASMQRTRFDGTKVGDILSHGPPAARDEQGDEPDCAVEPRCRADE